MRKLASLAILMAMGLSVSGEPKQQNALPVGLQQIEISKGVFIPGDVQVWNAGLQQFVGEGPMMDEVEAAQMVRDDAAIRFLQMMEALQASNQGTFQSYQVVVATANLGVSQVNR